MQQLLDFVALAFASSAVITAWFYGAIFERAKEALEDRGGLLGELAGCSLCMTYHVAFWLFLLLWLPANLLPDFWANIPRGILYAFAAVDLVHWLQGDHPSYAAPSSSSIIDLQEPAEDNKHA